MLIEKTVDFDLQRKQLVNSLMSEGIIIHKNVADAMLKVPRHFFVPASNINSAYFDQPLHIGDGQTISAPHMVAIMVEKLDLEKNLKVLEIGSGSGYHAAIVADIIGPNGHVYTVERIPNLVEFAKKNIDKVGFSGRITVVKGDGSKGLPEHAPFDRIYVTAASPSVPKPLVDQLKDGGKLLIPVNSGFYQDLICVIKRHDKVFQENYGGCVFVPLIGEYGYKF